MIPGGVHEQAAQPDMCSKCGQHPGTVQWSEGAIAMIHGCYEWRCEGCALRAQIAHAEERLLALTDLRRRLLEWERLYGGYVEVEARARGAIR